MDCSKECEKCEYFENNHEIVIHISGGCIPHTRYIRGVKCTKYGQCAYNALSLPTSTWSDERIDM